MKSASQLFLMLFVQYFILTFNTRAIAEGSFIWLFLTDVVIAWLGFTILKKVQEASSRAEMAGYVFGGALGAQLALLLSLHFIH